MNQQDNNQLVNDEYFDNVLPIENVEGTCNAACEIELSSMDVDDLLELYRRIMEEMSARVWNTFQSLTMPVSRHLVFESPVADGPTKDFWITALFQDPDDMIILAVTIRRKDASETENMEFQELPARSQFRVLRHLVELKQAGENAGKNAID
jgi:hypothetical protein